MNGNDPNASDALVRAMLDSSLDAVVGMDASGNVLEFSCTAERMFGYPRKEAIGKPLAEFMPADLRDQHRAGLRRYLETGEIKVLGKRLELRAIRKDGREFPIELTITRLILGGPPRFVGFIRDITESKRASEERRNLMAKAQEAQKLESLGVLAAGIAHDFNNVLVGILGNAGLALRRLSPESPVRELIKDIENAGTRAAELTNQMLAYSGKGRFVLRSIDLNSLIEEMAHLLKTVVSKKAVFNLDLDTRTPLIEADPSQIRQVVMNLIINASDALEDHSGMIVISTGLVEVDRAYLRSTYLEEDVAEGTYVSVEVADTGCGMDEETQRKIFDPFFSTKFAGRGLGLAAVLGIVRGHGGAIKIYSKPGKGTTFKVLFPLSKGKREPVIEAKPSVGDWQGKGTVLVIDDEETILEVVKKTLEEIGFTVLTAVDPRQGLATFRKHERDIVVVILDLTMPHMDGEEAFRRLRQVRSDARILLMSGYNEQVAVSRFVGKGLAGFLQKPFKLEDLVAKVHEALQSS